MDYSFHSDGCSVVSDYDQTECCVRHDWLYWKGGGLRDRLVADEEFFECVKETQSGWLAHFRWLGVRIGGVYFLPFRKWRWGYGWKWPVTSPLQTTTHPTRLGTKERPMSGCSSRPGSKTDREENRKGKPVI